MLSVSSPWTTMSNMTALEALAVIKRHFDFMERDVNSRNSYVINKGSFSFIALQEWKDALAVIERELRSDIAP